MWVHDPLDACVTYQYKISKKIPLGWLWPYSCLPTIICILKTHDETLLYFAYSLFNVYLI
jgi:hypothetical protein